MVSIHMSVNEIQSTSAAGAGTESAPFRIVDDRYCRHCGEIALAYDPDASSARCRSCGELA